jgi:uncharacterized Zn-binding protein involved in type VI secretion
MKWSKMSCYAATWSAALLALPFAAQAGPPAARVGDPGHPAFHVGSAVLAGSPNVRINGLGAARAGDFTSCPQLCFVPLPVPHSSGLITAGSGTVRINGVPAARVGDVIIESGTPGACQPAHSITSGSPSVFIGS